MSVQLISGPTGTISVEVYTISGTGGGTLNNAALYVIPGSVARQLVLDITSTTFDIRLGVNILIHDETFDELDIFGKPKSKVPAMV